MPQSLPPFSFSKTSIPKERRGVVDTKSWVVESASPPDATTCSSRRMRTSSSRPACFRSRWRATLYEGGVRVAACAAWPGRIPAGSAVTAPIHVSDLYPTLLKLAGASLDQPLPLDGRDAWPAIAEGKPSPHEEILINAAPLGGAIRVGDWKLVVGEFRDPGNPDRTRARRSRWDRPQLYDLSNDPFEQRDLAADRPKKVAELLKRYRAFDDAAVPPKAAPRAEGFRAPRVWGQAD